MNQIKSTEKVCYNCRYISWLIAIGQGLRCGHPTRREKGKEAPLIPSRLHTCELFTFRVEPKSRDK